MTRLRWRGQDSKDFRTKPSAHKGAVTRFLESEDRDKWNVLGDLAKDPAFVAMVHKHPAADDKLRTHVKSLHAFRVGDVVDNIEGSSGKKYVVKKLPSGKLGCSCRDWYFKGSVSPGYECKHIRAHKEKTAMISFSPRIKAFFDELEKIDNDRRRLYHSTSESDKGDMNGSLTTPLENNGEPDYQPPNPAPPVSEPEVILGGNA